MVISTGVDIVKVSRFQGEQAARFIQRVFSVREQEYIAGKGGKAQAQTMAGLFAAKEAVAKALGIGFSGFSPCDIEILRTVKGKPYVKLHRTAVRAFRNSTGCKLLPVGRKFRPTEKRRYRYSMQVSISHTDDNVIAFAVLTLFYAFVIE